MSIDRSLILSAAVERTRYRAQDLLSPTAPETKKGNKKDRLNGGPGQSAGVGRLQGGIYCPELDTIERTSLFHQWLRRPDRHGKRRSRDGRATIFRQGQRLNLGCADMRIPEGHCSSTAIAASSIRQTSLAGGRERLHSTFPDCLGSAR
jgi:hypothetical protein